MDQSQIDDVPALHLSDEPPPEIEFHIDDAASLAIFWLLALVTFLQFFTRYVLNNSFAWTEEIARYLLMWLTFFGGAVVFRRRANISIDLFVDLLPRPVGRIVKVVAMLVTIALLILLCWFAWQVAGRVSIQRMSVFDVSMAVVYYGVFAGLVIMTLRAMQAAWQAFRLTNPTQQTE